MQKITAAVAFIVVMALMLSPSLMADEGEKPIAFGFRFGEIMGDVKSVYDKAKIEPVPKGSWLPGMSPYEQALVYNELPVPVARLQLKQVQYVGYQGFLAEITAVFSVYPIQYPDLINVLMSKYGKPEEGFNDRHIYFEKGDLKIHLYQMTTGTPGDVILKYKYLPLTEKMDQATRDLF